MLASKENTFIDLEMERNNPLKECIILKEETKNMINSIRCLKEEVCSRNTTITEITNQLYVINKELKDQRLYNNNKTLKVI